MVHAWPASNQRAAKKLFSNWSTDMSDPMLLNFFFRRSTMIGTEEPGHFHYFWCTYLATGIWIGSSAHLFIANPHMIYRNIEKNRSPLDRWKLGLYSLPYFNHSLRNYAVSWVNTYVDNEPDYQVHHPWGIRPDRTMQHRRFFGIHSAPRYFVDDPLYEKTSHRAVERRMEAIGYYPDRIKAADDD
eukprot:GHVQ01014979.1.p1 GENE.GHVQ01014979.1~~GHVQ01014979.1.p1  ORF type:complete len:186 (+),score=12.21 GHVQ01014979.1:260-817(+)